MKDGIVAADTLQHAGGTIDGLHAKKLHRVNGCIVGGGGHVAQILLFVDWFRAGKSKDDRPNLDEDFCVLAMRINGKIDYYDKHFQPVAVGTISTIGSGRDLALGAMAAGATAEEAVKIAIKLDTKTGGKVRVMKV